jgi:hypothetical protein
LTETDGIGFGAFDKFSPGFEGLKGLGDGLDAGIQDAKHDDSVFAVKVA